jgi:beta-glucosidase
METVEAHCEDKPLDMIPYTDSMGNTYDFAFGLNWSGIIRDGRTLRYRKNR